MFSIFMFCLVAGKDLRWLLGYVSYNKITNEK